MKILDTLLLIGIIFLLFFTPIALGTVLPWAIFVMRGVVIILLGIWLLKMISQGRVIYKKSFLDIPLLIFLAVLLISTIFVSNYKRISWEYFSYFATGILFYFIISNNIQKDKHLKTLTISLLIVSFIMGTYGILQFLNILNLTPRVVDFRITSFYYNSNHYSGYLVMILPICISLFLYSKSFLISIILGFLSLLLGINLGLSYSWGEVAFLLSLIFLFSLALWVLEKKKVIAKAATLGILIVLISLGGMFIKGPQLPQNYLSERFDSMLNIAYASITGRINIFKYALIYIFNNPLLGTGLGTFIDIYPKYRGLERARSGLTNYAHNDYLQIACETGIIGLISFAIVIVALLSLGFQTISTSKGWLKALSIGVLSGIIAILFHGFTDGNLTIIPSNILYFYFLSGILSVINKSS